MKKDGMLKLATTC